MSIPYRTQQSLKRLAGTLLILALVAVIVWGMWILWLQRFVVYTRQDGAVLDFTISEKLAPGQDAVIAEEESPIEIYYNEGEDKVNLSTELTQMSGYYVTGNTLADDPAGVWDQIQALPPGTAVMLELKSIYGMFYYSTSTGRPVSEDADVRGVDQLLVNLKNSDYYTIARIPALRDRDYGLNNTNEGLPVSGGYLWMDEAGCYWLNPARQAIIAYLMDIAAEVKALGFDEVVFDEYYFPQTDQIVFNGDKTQTLENTANTLVANCATSSFAVSFVSDGSWTMPEGRTRVYRDDVGDTIALIEATQDLPMENPAVELVFITNNTDAAFDEYSVLRPIDMAHE